MKRMVINQPSTLQPLHELHGENVLMELIPFRSVVQIWFTRGSIISMQVPRNCLSNGWWEKEHVDQT